MNRLFLVAAAATSVITLYGATNAQAAPPAELVQTVAASERFDLGEAPLPTDAIASEGEFDIVFEDASEGEGGDFYEHPLNDAWLGMPFTSGKGKVLGFVVDAPVDESGEVTEVHVGTPDLYAEDESAEAEKDLMVFPASQVVLTDEAVVLLPSSAELVAQLAK